MFLLLGRNGMEWAQIQSRVKEGALEVIIKSKVL
jgi:hypothetical protein